LTATEKSMEGLVEKENLDFVAATMQTTWIMIRWSLTRCIYLEISEPFERL
jgi:hypothetical protein